MSIVTISRGSYTRGRQVAERLGERLGYEVISREVLISTSKEFNIPEIKLKKVFHNAPSILERFTYGKEKYLAFIRTNILEHLAKDNIIYHGLAGHAFLLGLVNHELSIHIQADFEDRVKRYIESVKKENGIEVTKEEARYRLHKDDEERHKWSNYVTGIDPTDLSKYDLIYNASKFNADDIVESIAQFLKLSYLQTTSESQNKIEQLMMAAKVKSAIVYDLPTSEVTCQDNIAYVKVNADLSQEKKIENIVKNKVITIENIKDVKVYVTPPAAPLFS